jgi:hypothetical protein
MLEVSLGDALDKLSILEIKRSRITDPRKLEEVHKEILALSTVPKTNTLLYDLLVYINTTIWDLTDTVKSKTEIDIEYAEISRSIFDNNQKRFRVKNMINYSDVGSLKEQKSYQPSQAVLEITDMRLAIPAIYALCTLYDQVVVIDGDDELRTIFTTPNVLFSGDVLGIPRYKDTFLEKSAIDRYTPKPTVSIR